MVKTTSTPAVDLARGLSDIWAFLSDTERQAIERQAIYQSFRKGEYIYRADEESVYLICILKGRVKLERAGVGGRNQIMRMLRSCEFFGYRSYFAAQGHITSAVAMESTTVACIPMNLMERIAMANADLSMYFIRALAIDLGESDQRTVGLTQKHIRGRLADSIIYLIDKYGWEADGCTVNIYLSREELAALSNMTTSNAIRTLATFVNEGILSVDGRRIKVLSPEKLRRINQCG